MIIKVAESGSSGPGLVSYLMGPGRANEHVDQRVMGGSDALAAEWAGSLSHAEARHLGRVVEARATVKQQEFAASSLRSLPTQAPASAARPHIGHVVFSLRPDEGVYSDEQWRAVATAYMNGMGWSGTQWVAVRHGSGIEGNDHMHLVLSKVDDSGRRIDEHNSARRTQEVRRKIESEFAFVRPLSDTNRVGLSSSYHRAEAEVSARKGRTAPARVELQRVLRSASTQAQTEAEYVSIGRAAGVEFLPRWNSDGNDLAGYSVRFRDDDHPERWIPASKVAPDLTLARLRPQWHNGSDQSREHWRADAPIVQPSHTELSTAATRAAIGSRHAVSPDWNLAVTHTSELAKVAKIASRPQWQRHSSELAALMSQASASELCPPDQRRALGDSAATLARLAQMTRDEHESMTLVSDNTTDSAGQLAARHFGLALRASSPNAMQGWFAVMKQMQRVGEALSENARARNELIAVQDVGRAINPVIAITAGIDGAPSRVSNATSRTSPVQPTLPQITHSNAPRPRRTPG